VSGFDDRLAEIKQQIEETEVDSVFERWLQSGQPDDIEVIDVRERDEWVDGHIEGATFVPRGLLDLKIENLVPNKDKKVILYCAGGTRSALAAKSLEDLGYNDVESVSGGFGAWKEAGYPVHISETLNDEQRTRYSRHLTIPEVGEKGQLKLLDTDVLMLGAGGLGSPAAYYLAAAGIGKLGIIDSDVVDRSNLQRQILHTDDRVGEPKTDSARKTLKGLNPDVDIETFNTRLNSDNILDIFDGYDMVVDGGDNFPTRYLINDACVKLGIPNVHGSVFRFEGQASVFHPDDEGPCYRCLYPEPPPAELAPSCQEAGVLGVIPGIIGMMQAVEVIKLSLDIGNTLQGRLLSYDALDASFRELQLERDPECPVCSGPREEIEFIDYDAFCSVDL
jgi:molybdopterin/thiamine biosynthesis adenylyltransferase/rhodanese-related sulfurtransferase